MPDWKVIAGDCVEQMAGMPEASVDAVVCDPPYGLEFMGKEWDSFKDGRSAAYSKGGELTHTDFKNLGTLPQYVNRPAKRCAKCGKQAWSGSPCQCEQPEWTLDNSPLRAFQAWCEAWAREALRVLKPGGHLLAFGGTRTYHRLACAIEDAGFEIRDTIAWMYGSGFPKSLDVSRAIDAAAGATREVVGTRTDGVGNTAASLHKREGLAASRETVFDVTAPATPDAARWNGWGTALKPAHEPIVVARKPLAGTVAANVLAHGTGALNVDGCRIEGPPSGLKPYTRNVEQRESQAANHERVTFEDHPSGRWPANVVLDPEAARQLDQMTGTLTSGSGPLMRNGDKFRNAYGEFKGGDEPADVLYGDSGGASRFFYCAKSSSSERSAGLPDGDRSSHPTVKPIALMRWLVRLVTPPGGTCLDPFAGSGTTGCAAVLEGFRFVGIEREPEYAAIARARIAWWSEHPDGVEIVKALEAERERAKVRDSGQLGLFGMTPEPRPDKTNREGEASAERRYTDNGGSNFAMKPGRRRAD